MLITDDQLREIIQSKGIVDQKILIEVAETARSFNLTLGEALVEKNIVSDEKLGILIAEYLKIPFISLSKIIIPEEIFRIIPEKVAKKKKVIPFARDESVLKLAMADPKDAKMVDFITRKTGSKVIPYMATEKDIIDTVRIYRKGLQKTFDELIREEIGHGVYNTIDEAPIIKVVDLLIGYAYQDKASDIHIEPEEKNSIVRFRIDGIMHDVLFMPKDLHDRIISRLKVIAKLRTDEHLAPQDGKIRMQLEGDHFDLRLSILPIADGEKAVLRILSSSARELTLLDLGMSEKDLKKVTNAYNKPYGMILSTGPTGSGKTTSIYSILTILNIREKNITTIEDPIEYRIKGVNQIQVNTKANLTFASGLRSILRQDPNIIFVGEIRDTETAEIAVNAALTGHLVLSTLHTNDAATALPRLIDMKVEPFLVASTVNVIIGQRLIRKICEMCRIPITVSKSELIKHIPENLISKYMGIGEEIQIYKGQGCKMCRFTGYKGRIGLFEILEVNKNIKKLITEKNDSDMIAKTAQDEGMTSMLEDGLMKVSTGITSLDEVIRVTKVESV